MTGSLTLWWGDPGLAPQYRADLLQGADRQRAAIPRAARAELDWRVSRALLRQVRASWPPGGPFGGDGGELGAAPTLSLSHARGHALVAAAPAGWRVGVDLEALRPRDTAALAEWCCTDDERAALARCGAESARLQAFYQLWTLKESFLKAAGLDFPADMRAVGLAPGPGCGSGSGSAGACASGSDADTASARGAGLAPWAGWRLRAPAPRGWQAWSAVLDDSWMASVVWLRPDTADLRPQQKPADVRPQQDIADVRPRRDTADAPAWRTAAGAAAPRVSPAGHWR